MSILKRLVPLLACLSLAACKPSAAPESAAHASHSMGSPPLTLSDWADQAQLFEGLGDFHRSIKTSSEQAQRYFDQGMRLMWGFNHDEATRSFAKAALLDPRCAACYWGLALTVGPNYNLPLLTAERAKVARQALLRAQAEAPHASVVEQALIEALAQRYPDAIAHDPGQELPILTAYAQAMGKVKERFPADLDVRTLYAESLMNLRAWKLWNPDGQAAPGTPEIVTLLESVLAQDPSHPGANHYLVHALEASPHPERALAAAQRLQDLAPAAGHLVHMPAHIFQRLGRYEEAAQANRRAAAADQAYLQRAVPPDYYAAMYSAHNQQFLAFSTGMQARKADTIQAVDRARVLSPDEMLAGMPGVDWYVAQIYTARVRFGLWSELLAMPAPDARLLGMNVGYLYGRGMAEAATGKVTDAQHSLEALKRYAIPADAGAGQSSLQVVRDIATAMLEARIRQAQGNQEGEIDALQRAVSAESRLSYDEPANWFVPSRHALGAALLRAGRLAQAEAVYREDLQRNPQNIWGLIGLKRALEAQDKHPDEATAAQLTLALQHADLPVDASVL